MNVPLLVPRSKRELFMGKNTKSNEIHEKLMQIYNRYHKQQSSITSGSSSIFNKPYVRRLISSTSNNIFSLNFCIKKHQCQSMLVLWENSQKSLDTKKIKTFKIQSFFIKQCLPLYCKNLLLFF